MHPAGGPGDGCGTPCNQALAAPLADDADRVRTPKRTFTGLTWDKGTSSWRVRVNLSKRQHHVGR